MKKRSIALLFGALSVNTFAAGLVTTTTTPIDHHPVGMIGLTYNLNGPVSLKNLGFSLNVLSSNQENKWVFGTGASFFPWSENQFGFGVGAGRNFDDSNCLVGWDFLQSSPTLGCGATDTKPKSKTTTLPVT